jgi:hypothetical protein
VPFYFINLLPTSLLYISILLALLGITRCSGAEARPEGDLLARQPVLKVPYILTLYREYTRALTFNDFCRLQPHSCPDCGRPQLRDQRAARRPHAHGDPHDEQRGRDHPATDQGGAEGGDCEVGALLFSSLVRQRARPFRAGALCLQRQQRRQPPRHQHQLDARHFR